MLVVAILQAWAKKQDAKFGRLMQFFMEELKEKNAAIRDAGMVRRMAARAIDKYMSYSDFSDIASESEQVAKTRQKLIDGQNRLTHMISNHNHRAVKKELTSSEIEVDTILQQMGVL